MKKLLTPTDAARLYLHRNFGPFTVTMSQAAQKQIMAAYIAGLRHGRNGSKK